MIQVSKEKISFSLNNASTLKQGDPRKIPLEFDLVSAHVCPHCSVVVQAIYKTDIRMRDLTQEHFELEKPMKPSKFAVSTVLHQVVPQYKSYLLTVGSLTVEMLREESHFSLANTVVSGQCKCRKVVCFPGRFDLTRYLLAMVRIITATEWYGIPEDALDRLRAGLTGANKEANSQKMFEELKGRINIAEDVTGKGAPLWLLGKSDWHYYTMQTAIGNLNLVV